MANLRKRIFILAFVWIVFSSSGLARAQETAVEGVGIKGITVGKSSQTDVVKKFGKDYEEVTYETYSKQLKYKKLGLSFFYCQSDAKQIIFSIEIRAPFKAVTAKGVVLGKSTVKDVERIYGKPDEQHMPAWMTYYGVDFRNTNPETDEMNMLEDDTLINEINLYTPGFTLCDKNSSDLSAK